MVLCNGLLTPMGPAGCKNCTFGVLHKAPVDDSFDFNVSNSLKEQQQGS